MNKPLNKESDKKIILLREMSKREQMANDKLAKLEKRISILESFNNQSVIIKCNLGDFLNRKGLNIKDYFAPVGYYLGANKVVSDDKENRDLSYHKGMNFNRRAGYHLPDRVIVSDIDHKDVTESPFGMIFSPRLQTYLPKVTIDTETFSKAEGLGDLGLDIMGGMTIRQISNLRNVNSLDRDLVAFLRDLFEDEHDNVSKELDTILGATNRLNGTFSNADGDRKVQSGKNLACRTKCNSLHPFNKSKRTKCQEDCDAKFKASQVQEERRQQRETRQQAKKEFRADKKSCKQKLKAGELSRSQYKSCVKKERSEKKETLKEEGGRGLTRVWRTFAKVFPLSAGARGSALVLIGENMFGIATKLAPAVLDDEKSRSLFKPSSIQKSKIAFKKVLKAWLNLGGQKRPLENAIKQGWDKRVKRVARRDERKEAKSNANGIEFEPFSNVTGEPISSGAIIGLGTTVLGTLTALIQKSGADKNPYLDGKAPQGFDEDLKAMDEGVPTPDPNAPQIDPETGKWIEPKTGKEIDPLTGEYKNEIFGMNKYLVIGLGIAGLVSLYLLTKPKGN